jgi:hypothetical protein
MKKYYPIDFDSKGNAILGDARNTPTSNSFIPTTWTPVTPEPEPAGNGIMSISITPAIETTPALDSVFPIYWEDIPAEDIEDGQYATKRIEVTYSGELGSEYHITATPTADWQVQNDFDQWAGKGETAEVYGSPFDLSDTMSFDITVATNTDTPAEYQEIHVTVIFTSEG